MPFFIGLGGSGVRFVQTLIEQENPLFSGALTIDVVSDDEAISSMSISSQMSQSVHDLLMLRRHLCLVDKDSTIESVVRSGIDTSYDSDDSQLALKELASWRPSSENLAIPLGVGAGRLRSLGRAISKASKLTLQSEIEKITSDDICIVTSTDGGTGSALLVDVLKFVDELDRSVNVLVIALNSIVLKGPHDVGHCANSVATLCELENYYVNFLWKRKQIINFHNIEYMYQHIDFQNSKAFGLRDLFVINRQDSDQVQFAIETLPDRISRMTRMNHGLRVKIQEFLKDISVAESSNKRYKVQKIKEACRSMGSFGSRYLEVQDSQITEELRGALDLSTHRFMDRLEPVKADTAVVSSHWAYCRSRILTEFVEPELIKTCIQGWLKALCLNRIQITDNQVQITDETGQIHQFLILRPIDTDGIDALPSVIEAAPIAMRSDPRSSHFGYGAINTLTRYAEADTHSILGEKLKPATEAALTFGAEFRNLIGLGTPLKLNSPIPLTESETARANLLTQKELSLQLVQMTYNGDEAVGTDGRITPPETFFRDIVEEYLNEIESMLSPPLTTSFLLQEKNASNNESRTEKVNNRNRRGTGRQRPLSGRLAALNAKPYAWLRYGVPSLLGSISALIFFRTLDNQTQQQSWADSATIVSGFMAGFAVILGAVALISSIQNSSVRIQRTDRLYEACLGVQEAITFFELGKEAALATNDQMADSKNLWNDPSLHLASMMLGLKMKLAMDTGLYRLLAYADHKNGVKTGTINSASALQAFSLLDGLVRIVPEIVYEKDRPRSEFIASPEQIAETANKLNEALSRITYRMVAKSLEFTPSTNL